MKMKIGVISLILFLTATSIVKGQNYEPSKVKEFLSLTGTVYLLSIFVDTEEDIWEDAEMEHYYEELVKGQDWIKDEASYYGKEVEFDNEYFFSDNKSIIYIDNIRRGDRPTKTVQKVMEELSYDDFDNFLAQNSFDFEEEKFKILLFVKSSNRSHAYNYWSIKDVDLAIVYCRSSYGTMTDQYVISHELLHQFGAWDLYHDYGGSQTLESAKKAKELFPHSIMLNTHSNKPLLEIDRLTAWRIGWSDFEDTYQEFDPVKNREKVEEELRRRQRADGKSIKFDLKKPPKDNNN